MKGAMYLTILLCLAVLFVGAAVAQDFFIYPNKGQSQDQLERDKFECYSWAKQNTGFDPMETPRASAPPPQKEAQVGGVGRGALRGGALGVATGAIVGGKSGAKKGLAAGAVGGGLVGGMRRSDQKRREQQAQEQWAQQQAAEYTQKRNSYNRAFAACLEGRGYTVK